MKSLIFWNFFYPAWPSVQCRFFQSFWCLIISFKAIFSVPFLAEKTFKKTRSRHYFLIWCVICSPQKFSKQKGGFGVISIASNICENLTGTSIFSRHLSNSRPFFLEQEKKILNLNMTSCWKLKVLKVDLCLMKISQIECVKCGSSAIYHSLVKSQM